MGTILERSGADGKPAYTARVRMKGVAQENATFQRRTDAWRWVQQVESAIREGRHLKTVEATRHTIGQMIDRYIAEVLPQKPKSVKHQFPQLERWKAYIGDRSLADLTPALIGEYRDRFANEVPRGDKKPSANTLRLYMMSLSHVLTIAMKEWEWIDDTLMRKVKKPRLPRGRRGARVPC